MRIINVGIKCIDYFLMFDFILLIMINVVKFMNKK